MVDGKQGRWGGVVLASLGVAMAIGIGVQLRLADPLSSPIIPAEDPYNHMALVREHLRDGNLDPLNEGSDLYPPGMHAFLAAAWAYTGADLYEIFRLGPVVFGAIGILGIAILLGRSDGVVAAFVGALALAMAPEAILRTTMMAPTALDIALFPFLLYALLEILRGRLGWAALAVPLALFLVFAHPWLLTILGLAGGLLLLNALLLRWPAARGPPFTRAGVAAAVAIVGATWGLSISGCWGLCGEGFSDKFTGGAALDAFAPFVALVAFAVAAAIRYAPRWLDRGFERPYPSRPHAILRGLACLVLLGALIAVTVPAKSQGFPGGVDLVRMFGWPILLMAAAGFVALPFLPSPVAHVGWAISAITYPFVIYNPLDSPFWPHRTAVYLGIGLVILAGVVAGAVARLACTALAHTRTAAAAPAQLRVRPIFASTAVLLVAGSLGGVVYAATPDESNARWYRLFNQCEFEALQEVSARAADQPEALIVTGDWQSKLVLAALTPDASRVWYYQDFFIKPDERDGFLGYLDGADRPILVVVTKYLKQLHPDGDTSFLNASAWTPLGQWCAGPGTRPPTLSAYEPTEERP